jgi:putative pyruvate formate lyase activating enzyme
VPTYVVSLAGCNWRCDFCLTGRESQDAAAGAPLDEARLDAIGARMCRAASVDGIRSVRILGGEPTVHLGGALRLIARVPPGLAVVWRTNAFASWEARRLLAGAVDVVLADLKFGSDACAARLSGGFRPEAAVAANLRWAARVSTLIVRHLVMPGHVDCCLGPAAAWLARELPGTPLSLMTGYVPAHRAARLPVIGRTLKPAEVERAWAVARASGVPLAPWAVVRQPRSTSGDAIRTDAGEVWIDRSGRVLVDGASAELLEVLAALSGEMRLDAAAGEEAFS